MQGWVVLTGTPYTTWSGKLWREVLWMRVVGEWHEKGFHGLKSGLDESIKMWLCDTGEASHTSITLDCHMGNSGLLLGWFIILKWVKYPWYDTPWDIYELKFKLIQRHIQKCVRTQNHQCCLCKNTVFPLFGNRQNIDVTGSNDISLPQVPSNVVVAKGNRAQIELLQAI